MHENETFLSAKKRISFTFVENRVLKPVTIDSVIASRQPPTVNRPIQKLANKLGGILTNMCGQEEERANEREKKCRKNNNFQLHFQLSLRSAAHER